MTLVPHYLCKLLKTLRHFWAFCAPFARVCRCPPARTCRTNHPGTPHHMFHCQTLRPTLVPHQALPSRPGESHRADTSADFGFNSALSYSTTNPSGLHVREKKLRRSNFPNRCFKAFWRKDDVAKRINRRFTVGSWLAWNSNIRIWPPRNLITTLFRLKTNILTLEAP